MFCFFTVEALVAPVENDNSGDGKLETPPMRLVKDLEIECKWFRFVRLLHVHVGDDHTERVRRDEASLRRR